MPRVCPDGTRSSAECSHCFPVICLLRYLPGNLKSLLVSGALCSVQSWHASGRTAGFLEVKYRSERTCHFLASGRRNTELSCGCFHAGLQSWPFPLSFFSTLGCPGLFLLLLLTCLFSTKQQRFPVSSAPHLSHIPLLLQTALAIPSLLFLCALDSSGCLCIFSFYLRIKPSPLVLEQPFRWFLYCAPSQLKLMPHWNMGFGDT